MRKLFTFFLTGMIILSGSNITCKAQDDVQAFKELLETLASNSQSEFFKKHYQGMLDVISSKATLTDAEKTYISETYAAFTNTNLGLQNEETYINREFPLVLAWISPTDGALSFTRIRLPLNWNPEEVYPMYLQLHGLWGVANSPIDFMTYSFRRTASSSYAFEDGYSLDPWGRGNHWYEGISETDIWECMAAFEQIAKVDPKRKYITGHSMGGYGTWYISGKSIGTWAAIGLHAAALQRNSSLVTSTVAQKFVNLPVYFVVGTNDGLYSINTQTYNLLVSEGIENVNFVTFEGGHEFVQENVENMYDWIRQFTNENPTQVATTKKSICRIHPNPLIYGSPAYINIDVSTSLELFDISGKKLKSFDAKNFTQGINKIDINGLKPGIYLYKATTDDEIYDGKLLIY